MSKRSKRSNSPQKNGKQSRQTAVQNPHIGKIKWGLFILGFLLYTNTIPHDYTQDDAIVIYENQFTTQGLAGIPGLLTNDTFFGFFKQEGKANLVSGGRYRPLTPILFAIEYQFFGKQPWIGHLINALLYGLTCMVIFITLRLFLRHAGFSESALMIALVASSIFALHPIHTEVVANIKGRDEICSMLLAMASLYYTLQFFLKKNLKYAMMAGGALFLGLLSKENAITFAAIIPLTIFFLKNGSIKSALKATIPAIAAVVIFLVIRVAVLGFDFGGTPIELLNNPFLKIENQQYVPFSIAEKSATVTYTLGKYLQLLVFPHPLTHDYYPRHIDIMRWGNWQVILSMLLHLALLFFAIKGLKTKKLWSYSILFYFITMSIVSNIVFPIGTNMSERFLFMPSLGFCLIAAYGFNLLLVKTGKKWIWAIPAVIALLFAIKTITRNTVWKDNYRLFLTDVQVSQKSAKLLNSVGGELIAQSQLEENATEKNDMINKAKVYLQRALEIHPNYKLAYLILGNAHFYQNDYEAAIKMFQRTLELDSEYRDGHKNLGVAYREAGKYRGEQLNDLPGALDYLLKAAAENPTDFEVMRLLGVSYGRMGQHARAIEFFTKELELTSDSASAYFNLGVSYQNAGDSVKAQELFEKARAIDPEIFKRRSNK